MRVNAVDYNTYSLNSSKKTELNEDKIFILEIQCNSRYTKPNSAPSNNIQRIENEI